MEIIIQESKWITGACCEKRDDIPYFCAIGFVGKALKIPEYRIMTIGLPCTANKRSKYQEKFRKFGLTENLEKNIWKANDFLHGKKRKLTLKKLFKKMGHTLEFIK